MVMRAWLNHANPTRTCSDIIKVRTHVQMHGYNHLRMQSCDAQMTVPEVKCTPERHSAAEVRFAVKQNLRGPLDKNCLSRAGLIQGKKAAFLEIRSVTAS